jgi:hypothetical protein
MGSWLYALFLRARGQRKNVNVYRVLVFLSAENNSLGEYYLIHVKGLRFLNQFHFQCFHAVLDIEKLLHPMFGIRTHPGSLLVMNKQVIYRLC